MKRIAAIFVFLALVAIAAVAQDTQSAPEGNDNFLLNLLENRLSTPERQIRLSGVSGALSSRARIERITISDQAGPWMTINNVQLDWSRLALLRGRVNINQLSAESITWLRKGAQAPSALPTAEAQPFSLPELPVSVDIGRLAIGTLSLEQPVFGHAARLSLEGSLSLASGVLDTKLNMKRLDTPGGTLDLTAGFSNKTRRLDVDLDLHEPAGGLISSLLNIEGSPSIDLTAQGSGPIDNVDVTFNLDANQQQLVDGVVALRQTDAGLGFDVRVDGSLSPLIPVQFRDFFADKSSVHVKGLSKTAGGFRLDTLRVAGAIMTIDGSMETGSDGFLQRLNLTGKLGDAAGAPVTLPVPGGRTRLQSAALNIDFGSGERWTGLVVLDRLDAADVHMEDVTFRLGGLAQNLDDPAHRNVTINVEGLATGVRHRDPAVSRALGDRIDLFADVALPPGGNIDVRQVQVTANGLSLFTIGTFANGVYTGRNAVRVADLSILAGVTGRPLDGAIDVRANGSVTPLSGGFDLTFEGGATDLALGNEKLDGLLAGQTAISGRAVRDEQGIRTENLRIENPQLTFFSNGHIASASTDIGFDLALTDLGAIDPRASGRLTAQGRAVGTGDTINLQTSAAIPNGSLLGRSLKNFTLGFQGDVTKAGDLAGTLDGAGALDGLVLDLGGDIARSGERKSIENLVVAVGPNRLSGNLAQVGTAPITGTLALDAPDIAPVAALALVDAKGSVKADLTLAPANVGQGVTIKAMARDVSAGANAIRTLDLDAKVTDAFGLPIVAGTLNGTDITMAGFDITTLAATAANVDDREMRLTANAALSNGTEATLAGDLSRIDQGFAVGLSQLDLVQAQSNGTRTPLASLSSPATLTIAGSTIELTPLAMQVGNGALTAHGSVGDTFDIDVALRDLPLAVANAIRPALRLGGTLNGTVRVAGARTAPDIAFDVSGAGLSTEITASAGLAPLAVTARGRSANSLLDIDATVTSGDGLNATARGTVPLGDGDMNLAVNLNAFPLALADRFAGRRGLRGTITGTAQLTGPLNNPAASFNLDGRGLSMTAMEAMSLPALAVTANGRYAAGTLTLDQGRVTGGGADISASGRVPFSGPGLDVRADGALPLTLLNPLLDRMSMEVGGVAQLALTARGTLSAPQLGGTATLAGGSLTYPQLNLRLKDIATNITLAGETARVNSLSAAFANGGTATAEGTVRLAPGVPVDLRVRLNEARYTDGQFVATTVNGDLTLTGPVASGGAKLGGTIDLARTEISIAEGLGVSQAVLDEVKHIETSRPVQETLDRARVGAPRSASSTPPWGIGLDVRINAPNQIFVRGRGLDVELGGQLRVQGRTNDIQPVGQFELIRGRLLVLAQRITFNEGSLQLVGNLDPLIRLVAETQSSDVVARVTVEGRVSAPQITFSSDPPLPQDEVLSRLLFNRATANLSAFQVAQLAAAAAELSGGGGNGGIITQLRGATGLDDLDILTQDDGSTAVRAGKYLSDKVYVDVQTDTEGVSRAEVRVDLSQSVTARGSVGSDGNTTLGLYYERDY